MLGGTIAARSLGDAGKRTLATEQLGARPEGVRPDAAASAVGAPPPAWARKP
jgi:hypothetical protein